MDYEKLIEQLRSEAATFRPDSFAQTMLLDAAHALSTLWDENERLRDELDEKEKYYDQMIDALAATDSTELDQMKRENETLKDALQNWHED